MISVIITTKNRIQLLRRAINSVLQQTHTDFELIIVDDASEDGTKEYCQHIQNDNIKYIRIEKEDSKGGNFARNIGIRQCKGQYIALLDDDDEWDETKLEKQQAAFDEQNNPNLALVYTGVQNVNVMYNENIIYKKIVSQNQIKSNKEILISNVIGNTSNPLIKKDILFELGLFDEQLSACQEYELWIRICQKYDIYFIKEPLTKYYTVIEAKKQISGNPEKYINSIKYITQKHELYLKGLNSKELKEREYQILCNIYTRYIISRDKKNARKYILKALKIKINVKEILSYVITFFKYETYLKIKLIFGIIKMK